MTMLNAWESWTLYDSVLINNNVETLFKNAGFFKSYNDLAVPAEIPMLNVRNNSVGDMYNNFDSRDKLPFAFECWSMGISFKSAAILNAVATLDNEILSDILFTSELPKHCAVQLMVSQDEKLVQTVTLFPDGQGPSGWASDMTPGVAVGAKAIQNVSTGVNHRENRWKFPEPVLMPRGTNISAKLIISEYGRELLAGLIGNTPGFFTVSQDPDLSYWSASIIRLSMYGKREVQQRNRLHYG